MNSRDLMSRGIMFANIDRRVFSHYVFATFSADKSDTQGWPGILQYISIFALWLRSKYQFAIVFAGTMLRAKSILHNQIMVLLFGPPHQVFKRHISPHLYIIPRLTSRCSGPGNTASVKLCQCPGPTELVVSAFRLHSGLIFN